MTNMFISVYEHYHYSGQKGTLTNSSELGLNHEIYQRYPVGQEDRLPYYKIQKDEAGLYTCETHYYVGLDWIVEGEKAIHVAPKQNNYPGNIGQQIKINYLTMLFEALEEPQNIEHLSGLCEIDFNQKMIPFPQEQDELSIFLVIEYLQVLRHLVRKGLKKQYYFETSTLNGRVKGKVRINRSLTHQMKTLNKTSSVCTYQIFGVNHEENKLLKKAYVFAARYLELYPKQQFEPLINVINYIRPAFTDVQDDLEIKSIKAIKENRVYKEYGRALKLAQLLLKRFSYNLTYQSKTLIPTPAYWIDMSKLFELYVYKKLKEIFPGAGTVKYHQKMHYQELDFIVNGKDCKGKACQLVIDAKYKPQYDKNGIQKDDARQLAGYTRLKKVYDEFGITGPEYPVIDAWIIYPDQRATSFLNLNDIKVNSNYVQFFKLGIRLPEY